MIIVKQKCCIYDNTHACKAYLIKQNQVKVKNHYQILSKREKHNILNFPHFIQYQFKINGPLKVKIAKNS